MKLTIEINMDNDAFQPDWRKEVSRLLHKIRNKVNNSENPPFILLDSNGNTIGKVFLEDVSKCIT